MNPSSPLPCRRGPSISGPAASTRRDGDQPRPHDEKEAATYADTERSTTLSPALLDEWTPAFLAQLCAPGAQFLQAVGDDGRETVYLFDTGRESFAALREHNGQWTVRQGGPVAVWDAVEGAVAAWREAGAPGIDAVRVEVNQRSHTYWVDGVPALRWEHRID
ncbi:MULTISPECIES: hypothetical protein [unclassified Streptomyces]|uniref:hypothetical protein n=1 Tax=unclassified Streptomyces TaxID=2593676 RepID=UPI003D72C6F2